MSDFGSSSSPMPSVRCQTILPTIVAMSAAEKSSQRFGADIAERAKTQAKRHGGRLIWRLDDCHSVIPPLRPENVLHSHSKRVRQLLEGFCPFRRFLSVADSLIGELRKNDISYHGHPPWLGPRATWRDGVVLRLPQQLHRSIDLYHCCSRHAWPEGCTSARSALLPSPIFRPWDFLTRGHLSADVSAIIGTLDIVFGEIGR
jgi:hypothetical protein